jgi:hypothetical protein
VLAAAALVTVALATNPCAEPGAACPDLTMRRPSEMHLLQHRYLASTNQIVNVGAGPMQVNGHRVSSARMHARQYLNPGPGGKPMRLPDTGLRVVFHDTITRGAYWKLLDAARFELWSMHTDGRLARRRRDGPKLIYCLRDLFRLKQPSTGHSYPGSPRTRQYPACSQARGIERRILGTSVGWTDTYPWSYPQNWISVRGLRGCFAYVHRADPEDKLLELREDNNASAVVVRLPWKGPGRRGCPALQDPNGVLGGAPQAPPAAPGDGYRRRTSASR